MSTATAAPPHSGRKPVLKPDTEWIDISQIGFDPRVNRVVKRWQVDYIANNFDVDAIGVIDVSIRKNGDIICLGGQHRVLALRQIGYDDQKIECRIHAQLTVAREAKLALWLNKTRQSTHADEFIHRVVAEDPEAMAINDIVVDIGLCISPNGKRDGAISATKALERVYRGVGYRTKEQNPAILHDTLRVILRAWGKGQAGLQGYLIEGVGAVLLRYGNDVDLARLATKLQSVPGGPTKIIERARLFREAHNGVLPRCAAAVIAETYNHGTRTGKLPEWFSGE